MEKFSVDILTHAGCWDGVTSAWIIEQQFDPNDFAIRHINGKYGMTIAELTGGDVLYMADFSLPLEQIEQIAKRYTKIIILDHHATSAKALGGTLPENVEVTFDMDRSGATITWDHFNPNTPRPPFVAHVEDWDLWHFAMDNSKILNAARDQYAPTIENVPILMKRFDHEANMLLTEGSAILAYRNMLLDYLVHVARPAEIARHRMLIAAAPYSLGSTLGERLAQEIDPATGQPYGVGAYYIDHDNNRQFGLRALGDNGIDVAAIAEGYGGGGHVKASGFKVEHTHPLAKI